MNCSKCLVDKEVEEFRSRGPGRLHSWCRECHKEYDAQRYVANKGKIKERNTNYRKKLIDELIDLRSNPCTDCGNEFHFSMMEWDHLPQYEKICSPYEMACFGKRNRMLQEIAKCDLVCANCHRFRTWQRKGL